MTFSYREFTTRNIGFITEEEQARLRDATVFVCGTGGMGGAAIHALVRAGVGKLIIADIDDFEVSNLNRQVFCNLSSIDHHKAVATRDACLQINPEIEIEVLKENWPDRATEAIGLSAIVINGTDDLSASLLLYRKSRQESKAVIDAYASPLPSIFLTRPNDPMPEERLGYPTIGTDWDQVTDKQRAEAFMCEAEHVVLNSSSRNYVDIDLAREVAAGSRSRMSFAPMVITTGMLMAYEAIGAILDRPSRTDAVGWFFNPYKACVERPRNRLVASLLRPFVRKFLASQGE